MGQQKDHTAELQELGELLVKTTEERDDLALRLVNARSQAEKAAEETMARAKVLSQCEKQLKYLEESMKQYIDEASKVPPLKAEISKLNLEIEPLRKTVSDYDERIRVLSSSLGACEAALSDMREAYSSLEQQRLTDQTNLQSLREELATTKKKLHDLQKLNTTHGSVTEEKEAEIRRLNAKISNLINESSILQKKLTATINEKQIAEEKLSKAEEELRSAEEECQALARVAAEFKEEFENSQKAAQEAEIRTQEALKNLNEHLLNSDSEHSNLKKMLSETQEKLRVLSTERDGLLQEQAKLRKSRDSLHEQLSKLEESLRERESSCKNLAAALAKSQQATEASNKDLAALRAELEEVRVRTACESEDAQEKITVLESNFETEKRKSYTYEQQVASLKEQIQTLEDNLAGEVEARRQAESKVENIDKERRVYEVKSAHNESAVGTLQAELDGAEQRIEALRESLHKEEEARMKLESVISDFDSSLEELNAIRDNLEMQLEQKVVYIEALSEERDAILEEKNHLAEINDELQGERNALREERKSLVEEKTELISKVSNLEHRVVELEGENEDLQLKAEDLEDERGDLESALETCESSKAALEERLNEVVSRCAQQEETISVQKNQIEVLSKDLDILGAVHAETCGALAESRESAHNLSNELESANNKIEELEESIYKNEREALSLQQKLEEEAKNYKAKCHELDVKKLECDGLKTRIEVVTHEKSALECERDALFSALESLRKHLQATDTSHASAIAEYEKEVSSLKRSIEEMQCQLDEVNEVSETRLKTVRDLEIETEQLRSTVEEKSRDLSDVSGNLESVSANRDNLTTQLTQVNEELGTLKTSLADTKRELTQSSKKVTQLEASLAEKTKESSDLSAKVETLNSHIEQLSEDKERLSIQLKNTQLNCDNLEDSLQESETIRRTLESNIANMKQELETVHNDYTSATLEITSLRAQLVAEAAKVELWQEAANEASATGEQESTKIKDLHRKINVLQQDIEDLTTKLESSNSSRTTLQKECAKLNEDVKLLKNQLENAKSTADKWAKRAAAAEPLAAHTVALDDENKQLLGRIANSEVELSELKRNLLALQNSIDKRDNILLDGVKQALLATSNSSHDGSVIADNRSDNSNNFKQRVKYLESLKTQIQSLSQEVLVLRKQASRSKLAEEEARAYFSFLKEIAEASSGNNNVFSDSGAMLSSRRSAARTNALLSHATTFEKVSSDQVEFEKLRRENMLIKSQVLSLCQLVSGTLEDLGGTLSFDENSVHNVLGKALLPVLSRTLAAEKLYSLDGGVAHGNNNNNIVCSADSDDRGAAMSMRSEAAAPRGGLLMVSRHHQQQTSTMSVYQTNNNNNSTIGVLAKNFNHSGIGGMSEKSPALSVRSLLSVGRAKQTRLRATSAGVNNGDDAGDNGNKENHLPPVSTEAVVASSKSRHMRSDSISSVSSSSGRPLSTQNNNPTVLRNL